MARKNADAMQINGVVCVSHDMITGRGEDCLRYDIRDNYCIMGAFDGCGGLGALRYPDFRNQTGAYLASRLAGKACFDWFQDEFSPERYGMEPDDVRQITRDMEETLRSHFAGARRLSAQTESGRAPLKGSMFRIFPTTASVSLCRCRGGFLTAAYFWAGDSRGYFLNRNGLMQVTRDDIRDGVDALQSLRKDLPLTNLVAADLKFHLHAARLETLLPALSIVATDGCFDYLPTPMHFEYLILRTLRLADSIEAWKKDLERLLLRFAGDDFSMEIGVFGFRNFQDLREYFTEREQYLRNHYIRPHSDAVRVSEADGIELAQKMWMEYRSTYYRNQP